MFKMKNPPISLNSQRNVILSNDPLQDSWFFHAIPLKSPYFQLLKMILRADTAQLMDTRNLGDVNRKQIETTYDETSTMMMMVMMMMMIMMMVIVMVMMVMVMVMVMMMMMMMVKHR